MKKIFALTILIAGLFTAKSSQAQVCDTIASLCSEHLPANYISDGQSYRALLLNDQVAEFHVTLYGNSIYRIAACSGLEDGNLIFSVYDQDRNLLFTNKDFKNAPYWDFKITNTLDCIIEAQLDNEKLSSGCAVLLIGFKK
tara:strand:- start:91103 stop:91525 length:423 start_codon:yes stop_codon:yes gene_type:complete